ncbi:hypothetical protein M1M07_07625 [Rhodococcus sp. HM1]|uniref:hypothetical protein n=1 Tax=Rhodococcus sp. HM1 TaxID=2937759 RepID=UPI00200B4405|nr:hypothetical protein [Rhodococcus sp. HM1]MCK8670986.1 hypothetical protein [Rhodococcus sp. HM1]
MNTTADPQPLDRAHTTDLARMLGSIRRWIAVDLDRVITKQTARPEHIGGKGSETPLPLHLDASDVAFDLHGVLTAWIEDVCRATLHPHPGWLRIRDAASWLERHVFDLARLHNAHQAYDEINDAYLRAYAAVDLPERQKPPADEQRTLDDAPLTKTELRHAVQWRTGRPLKRQTLNSWIDRGKLTPNEHGYFWLVDALKLL